jgi:hypothetical protein
VAPAQATEKNFDAVPAPTLLYTKPPFLKMLAYYSKVIHMFMTAKNE